MTRAIQKFHWDNYPMMETVNTGTVEKIELTRRYPTDMATQMWANTQLTLKANHAIVTTSFVEVQMQLATKQGSLTPSTAIFMNAYMVT